MSFLKDKTILLISPQSWGDMYLSKHHYAIELAGYGNQVYFLNPPNKNLDQSITITPSKYQPDLYIIDHKLKFPYDIKFHAIQLFHWLIHSHIKKILKAVSKPIDIVWSFDLGNIYPFKFFPKTAYKIFHPVDEPNNKAAIASALGSDILFSVTNEILNKFPFDDANKFFINHGISKDFLIEENKINSEPHNIHVGYSGNLTRNDIDRKILLQIINSNKNIIFDFWGNYNFATSNVSGSQDNDGVKFISQLQNSSNVNLHGSVSPKTFPLLFKNIDAFLICYDVEKDQSKGTNYHKVMEYLSTGKVIISNNITTYKDMPSLIQMVPERNTNKNLPDLFNKIIKNLEYYNSEMFRSERMLFASNNTYQKQIALIDNIISKKKAI